MLEFHAPKMSPAEREPLRTAVAKLTKLVVQAGKFRGDLLKNLVF